LVNFAILCDPGEENEAEKVPFEEGFEDKARALRINCIKFIRSSPEKSRKGANSEVGG